MATFTTDRLEPMVRIVAGGDLWTAGKRSRHMRVTAERLRRLTEAILKSGGSAGSEAELVANHLVQAKTQSL